MSTALCADDLPWGSVPQTLAKLGSRQLAELREYADLDEVSSTAAKQRLGEHIARETARRAARN